MLVKKIHFLSGLPRSGSTLLGSVLAQNHEVHVTPTSPVLDLLCATNDAFLKLKQKYTYDYNIDAEIYKAIISTFYSQFKEPIIIDKHRGWPRNVLPARAFVVSEPRIICTYRPISEVITSYIVLMNKNSDNFVDNVLKGKRIPITIENRAKCLWEEYISDPYESLKFGIKNYNDCVHLVDYNEIISNPHGVLDGIYNFIGLDSAKHDFGNIRNACAEDKDEAWGLKDLHTIRPMLNKVSVHPHSILGPFLSSHYDQFNITK